MASGVAPFAPRVVIKTALALGMEVVGHRGSHVLLEAPGTGRRVEVPQGGAWRDKVPHYVIQQMGMALEMTPASLRKAFRDGRGRRRSTVRPPRRPTAG